MGKILNRSAMLVDTDVVVDYLREVSGAVAFLEFAEGPLFMSSITVAELYAGVREGKERQTLEEFLQAFEIVPVNHQVAKQGGLLRRKFVKSYGVGLADAIIAATAKHTGTQLVTLSRKHFPILTDLVIPYRKA